MSVTVYKCSHPIRLRCFSIAVFCILLIYTWCFEWVYNLMYSSPLNGWWFFFVKFNLISHTGKIKNVMTKKTTKNTTVDHLISKDRVWSKGTADGLNLVDYIRIVLHLFTELNVRKKERSGLRGSVLTLHVKVKLLLMDSTAVAVKQLHNA